MSVAVFEQRQALDPRLVVDHPSGYLALSERNRRFGLPGVSGFIAYRAQGLHWIGFGGVHAATADRGPLLDAFVDQADRRRRSVVFVQVRGEQADLFRSRGFNVNPFGATYGVRLPGFSLAGTKRMKARQKVKQARAAGLRVREVGVEAPRDEFTFMRLRAVSDAWLEAKRKKELDFMIGELGGPENTERRIFVVVDAADEMQGLITYVPVWGSRPGHLHDLTRRLPGAPVGAMELCNAVAIERFVEEGAPYLHFGFTPFAVEEEAAAADSGVLSWIVRFLWRHGRAIYPAQSQVAYKLKWAPDYIEPEFLACRPLSVRAAWDLLLLTRSL
ncbi:MAG: DUF2156 domain-containing protein [Gemmataceae bacterium]